MYVLKPATSHPLAFPTYLHTYIARHDITHKEAGSGKKIDKKRIAEQFKNDPRNPNSKTQKPADKR